ncbi:hypothetical protein GCM10010321_27380 [Streptomyces chartreusis]|nr:hypothetical protein GCM10010321_27380 [Streptomyces chartreusis]
MAGDTVGEGREWIGRRYARGRKQPGAGTVARPVPRPKHHVPCLGRTGTLCGRFGPVHVTRPGYGPYGDCGSQTISSRGL